MRVQGSHDIPIADPAAPPRPPQPQRDTLDGLMTATLAPAVQPYRERLLDILHVVDRTQIGRELLYDIRALAGRGHYPFVDLATPRDVPLREAAKPHGLFLSVAMLTAPASEIGLAPEVEHAPAVVMRLVQIRNALAVRAQGNHSRPARIDPIDVPMDPIAAVVAFRKELRLSCIPARKDAEESHPYEAVTESGGNARTAAHPTARRVFRWTEQKVQAFRNFVLRRRDEVGGDGHSNPSGRATPDKPSPPCIADVSGQVAPAVHESPEPVSGTPERPIIKQTARPRFVRHQRSPSGRWPKQGEEWK